jgi:Tol biopolymer transport system component
MSNGERLDGRLDSWKEIARYLGRSTRTLRRWELAEGLPVHRLAHEKRGSVYAYRAELDEWWRSRGMALAQEPDSDDSQAFSEPRQSGARVGWLNGAIIGVLIISGAASWTMGHRTAAISVKPNIIPLTSDPGSEIHPSLSPDGSQVVYSWDGENRDNADIYVKLVSGGHPLRLTIHPARDISPVWSPTGDQIAFVRNKTIYLISPLGGEERKLLDFDGSSGGHFLAWTPDGKWVAFNHRNSPPEPYAIYKISTTTGEKRLLTHPPLHSAGDMTPAFSPDGRYLAFVRNVSALAANIQVAPAEGGAPHEFTRGYHLISGLAWMPDSKALVFGIFWGVRGLWRLPVGSGGRPVSDDEPEHLSLPDQVAVFPSIVQTNGSVRLAFCASRLRTKIRSWELGDKPAKPGLPFASSTWSEEAPRFSPDGRRVAFVSDRSGTTEIWTSGIDGKDPVQLTNLRSYVGVPRWSPDGSQISFDCRSRNSAAIWLVDSKGGNARRFTPDNSVNARSSWSADGKWIFFRSNRSGENEIWKMPSRGGDPQQVTHGGGSEAFASPDGEWLYFLRAQYGGLGSIWRVRLGGGEAQQFLDSADLGTWCVSKQGVYFLSGFMSAPRQVSVLKSAPFDGSERVVMRFDPLPPTAQALAINPDGTRLLLAFVENNPPDLMIWDNFR